MIGLLQSGLIVLAAVGFFAVDTMMSRKYKAQRVTSDRNILNNIIAVIAALILLAQPIWLPQWGWQPGRPVLVIGLILILSGNGLNFWARRHLGPFYAQHSRDIQPNHRLITSGPYRWVRHPIYLAYLVVMAGVLLVAPSIFTLLAAVINWRYFIRAASVDERALLKQFPAEYEQYMNQTPRFVPWHKLPSQ